MRSQSLLAAVLAVGLIAGCDTPQAATPAATVCDGISSEVGGCDPTLPKFAGTTCDDVARELGREVDSRILAIYRGPESKAESKAVRAGHLMGVLTSLANRHIRRIGLIKECTAPAFLAVAEAQFSTDLRAHAGEILYDGTVATYEQWRTALLDMVTVIDQDEDASVPPS